MPPIHVAYLGPSGTYSHQAASEAFSGVAANGADVQYSIVGTIGDAINFLDHDLAPATRPSTSARVPEERYSVIPIHNFIQGPVRETLEGLRLPCVPPTQPPESTDQDPDAPWTWEGSDCILPVASDGTPEPASTRRRIVGHIDLPIQHALLMSQAALAAYGPENVLEHITKVESHEQALGQCQAYLSAHLQHAQRVPVASTALAASHVQHHDDLAAIASSFSAQLYGAHVYAKGVQDKNCTFTRPARTLVSGKRR